jgi:hypothetical protein
LSVDDGLDIFQKMRRTRIRLFEAELRRREKVNREQFLAEMDILYGIRPKTGREYLETLERNHRIEIQGNVIVWIAH